MPTERVWMMAPGSRIGPATEAERQALRSASLVGGKYEQIVDRESAYEVLLKRNTPAPGDAAPKSGSAGAQEEKGGSGAVGLVSDFIFGSGSEERRVGNGGVGPVRSRWGPI